MATIRDMERAGVSARRALYWTQELGYLQVVELHPGSGGAMEWPAGEVAVAALMARLTKAGLRPDVAHKVARGERVLGPGIRIVIDEET